MASSAASIPSGCTPVADSEDLNRKKGLKEIMSDPIVREPDIAEVKLPVQEYFKASESLLHWKEAACMPCSGEQIAVTEQADFFRENPNDISAEETKAVTVVVELAPVQRGGVRPIARSKEPSATLSVKPSKFVPRESRKDNVLPQLSPINGSAASAEVVMIDSTPKLLDEASGNQQRDSFLVSKTARQHFGSWKLERQVRSTTAAGVNRSAQTLEKLQDATGALADAAPAGVSAAAATAETAR
jgi:hypothetical protein